MDRTLLKASLIVIVVSAATVTTAPGYKDNECDIVWHVCCDRCGVDCKSTSNDCYKSCVYSCSLLTEVCYGSSTCGFFDRCSSSPSAGNALPPNTTGTPPPGVIGQAPNPVGVAQPPGSTPPPKLGLQPPGNVGVNKQPPNSGGGTTPPGPVGVHPVIPIHPVNPVGNQPGTGTQTGEGNTPGQQIYAIKPPVVTTSPIGITTTTVYDSNGNSLSMNTDPTGKFLSKTTTILDKSGGSKSTTTGADGKILNTLTKTSDGKRILYDSTGKMVSQGKITTTGTGGTYSTGKGHKESSLGESQKHKEKGMNQVFHEEKQSSAPSHPSGRHR